MYVFVCNSLKYLYDRGRLIIRLENGIERMKVMYVSYHGLER